MSSKSKSAIIPIATVPSDTIPSSTIGAENASPITRWMLKSGVVMTVEVPGIAARETREIHVNIIPLEGSLSPLLPGAAYARPLPADCYEPSAPGHLRTVAILTLLAAFQSIEVSRGFSYFGGIVPVWSSIYGGLPSHPLSFV
jgi:hypothetical protein